MNRSERFTKITQGQIFIATHGEYDDFAIMGAFVAKADIDMPALLAEFRQVHSNLGKDSYEERYRFIRWLCVEKGLCDEIPMMQMHVCNYSMLADDEARSTPAPKASRNPYWTEINDKEKRS